MRARILKPGFFINEQLAQVSPWARLLFQGLWCVADRSGRLEERPLRLKAEVFPYDDVDCAALLNELAGVGVIQRYEANGRRYIEVPGFERHQNPHPNEPASKLPGPNDDGSHNVTSARDKEESTRADRVSSDRVSSDQDPDPDRVTPIRALRSEAVVSPILDNLHEQVHRLVFGGSGYVDVGWCEDLIRRGATQTDVDHAIQMGIPKRSSSYVRAVLEGRVKDREQGRDPDAVKQRRAPNAMQPTPAQRDRFKAVVVRGVDDDGKPIREVAP